MSDPLMSKSRMRLWFLLPLIAFIGGIVMFYFSLGKKTEVTIDTAVNRPVPSFALPLLSNTSQTVSNDELPDHPYLINVWGSWCPTCIIEHPFLMQLQQQGVDMVGVNYKDELPDALNYLQSHGNPFLFSVQDYTGDMAIDLGLTGAPETFVVDEEGHIRQHIIGEVNQGNWTERIAPCFMMLNAATGQQQNFDGAPPDSNSKTDIAEVCQ